jgi:steroid delta-isomerase-like uncharacterized protein
MRVLIIVGYLVLGAIAMCSGCTGKPSCEDIERQNMATVRRAHAELASGNFDGFKALLAPHYVRHCQAMPPGLQEIHGTEKFFAFIQEYIDAVPVYRDTISVMIAQGDKVAYVSTISGTQTGPMGGLPASGKDFTLVNIIIQRLENGKIAETWVSWDNVAMLTQLGFMP